MAFTSTINTPSTAGGLKILTGTYASTGGSTGGEVETSLVNVYAFIPTPTGAAVVADVPVPNEDLPKGGGDVTLVTTANESGTWVAFGE